MVNLVGISSPFGSLMGALGVTARGLSLLGQGQGSTMRWIECLANFAPLKPDLICVKQRRTINLGGCPFGGLMGTPGVTAGELGL